MCIQLNRADIPCLSVSMVELTLTLLEVPGLAVVTLVLESSCCSQGTATEMSSTQLLLFQIAIYSVFGYWSFETKVLILLA